MSSCPLSRRPDRGSQRTIRPVFIARPSMCPRIGPGGARAVVRRGYLCVLVWVNGIRRRRERLPALPSEFDLATPRARRDSLAVQVVNGPTPSYVEDQDQCGRPGSTGRSQSMRPRPRMCSTSLPGPDSTHDQRRSLKSRSTSQPARATVGLRAALYDAAVQSGRRPQRRAGHSRKRLAAPRHRRTDRRRAGGQPGSAESRRYTRSSSRCLSDGSEVRQPVPGLDSEHRGSRPGAPGHGKMVYLKGVNRHEHHDTRGTAVDREDNAR